MAEEHTRSTSPIPVNLRDLPWVAVSEHITQLQEVEEWPTKPIPTECLCQSRVCGIEANADTAPSTPMSSAPPSPATTPPRNKDRMTTRMQSPPTTPIRSPIRTTFIGTRRDGSVRESNKDYMPPPRRVIFDPPSSGSTSWFPKHVLSRQHQQEQVEPPPLPPDLFRSISGGSDKNNEIDEVDDGVNDDYVEPGASCTPFSLTCMSRIGSDSMSAEVFSVVYQNKLPVALKVMPILSAKSVASNANEVRFAAAASEVVRRGLSVHFPRVLGSGTCKVVWSDASKFWPRSRTYQGLLAVDKAMLRPSHNRVIAAKFNDNLDGAVDYTVRRGWLSATHGQRILDARKSRVHVLLSELTWGDLRQFVALTPVGRDTWVSIVAQTLRAIYDAQRHLKAVHSDLHWGNLLIAKHANGDVTVKMHDFGETRSPGTDPAEWESGDWVRDVFHFLREFGNLVAEPFGDQAIPIAAEIAELRRAAERVVQQPLSSSLSRQMQEMQLNPNVHTNDDDDNDSPSPAEEPLVVRRFERAPITKLMREWTDITRRDRSSSSRNNVMTSEIQQRAPPPPFRRDAPPRSTGMTMTMPIRRLRSSSTMTRRRSMPASAVGRNQQCGGASSISNAAPPPFIEWRTTPCFGQCPVYHASIDRAGRGTFHLHPQQQQHAANGGARAFQLSMPEAGRLVHLLRRSNWFSLPPTIDLERITDVPSTIVRVFRDDGTSSHEVRLRSGLSAVQEQLVKELLAIVSRRFRLVEESSGVVTQ